MDSLQGGLGGAIEERGAMTRMTRMTADGSCDQNNTTFLGPRICKNDKNDKNDGRWKV